VGPPGMTRAQRRDDPFSVLRRRIHDASAAKDLKEAMRAYGEIATCGSRICNGPTVELTNTLLHLARMENNMARADCLSCCVCGVVALPRACSHAPACLASQEVCRRLLDDLKRAGKTPVEASYTALIATASTMGDVVSALQFLEAMKADDVPPRLRSYSPILVALAQAADGALAMTPADAGATAERLYAEMRAGKIQLMEADYVQLMLAYARTGRGDVILRDVLPEAMETVYTLSAESCKAVQCVFDRFVVAVRVAFFSAWSAVLLLTSAVACWFVLLHQVEHG
jgi:hypothetical protein